MLYGIKPIKCSDRFIFCKFIILQFSSLFLLLTADRMSVKAIQRNKLLYVEQ